MRIIDFGQSHQDIHEAKFSHLFLRLAPKAGQLDLV